MQLTRRKFVAGASTLAFAGLAKNFSASAFTDERNILSAYGPLETDPAGLLDLPKGFSYRVISELGNRMDDGYLVPDRADGMGCFALEGSLVALVRNHEISLENHDPAASTMHKPLLPVSFDQSDIGEPLPGGTTTIIYDIAEGKCVKEYRSLIGTVRNCAGGVTPWQTWLSCEETVFKAGKHGQLDHGWVFEVPSHEKKPEKPVALKAMGRFNHEAAAVDPRTGIVYMTEDRPNSLFYRFIPNQYGHLEKGGKLQALGLIDEIDGMDSRNWDGVSLPVGQWKRAKWIDLDDVQSPNDDLRVRGHRDGGVMFARGEGIHWGDGELYFCCTSGGPANLGQVMRYQPSPDEGTMKEADNPGRLQLFFESADPKAFNLGDNLTVCPNGHLLVCEDQYTTIVDNYIRGVTPDGRPYPFARLRTQSETAGVCFSPDGRTLFVNVYSPTKTLAITGPWDRFSDKKI